MPYVGVDVFCISMRVWRVSSEDGEQRIAFDDEKQIILGTLTPGSVALYRLQPRDEEPYAIEYYLKKSQK